MTQPPSQQTVSLEQSWAKLMQTMGRTNLARASQARKAANMIHNVTGKR
jgi:hypothetical protein